MPQEALVREVEIESGATLNVSNLALRVINGVVINGTLNLLGEAQLLQHHHPTDDGVRPGLQPAAVIDRSAAQRRSRRGHRTPDCQPNAPRLRAR